MEFFFFYFNVTICYSGITDLIMLYVIHSLLLFTFFFYFFFINCHSDEIMMKKEVKDHAKNSVDSSLWK